MAVYAPVNECGMGWLHWCTLVGPDRISFLAHVHYDTIDDDVLECMLTRMAGRSGGGMKHTTVAAGERHKRTTGGEERRGEERREERREEERQVEKLDRGKGEGTDCIGETIDRYANSKQQRDAAAVRARCAVTAVCSERERVNQ